MIVQVGTDCLHVAHNSNPEMPQMRGRAEARELKQVRRSIGAPADDHLAPGPRHTSAGWRMVLHADSTIVLDQDAGGLAARANNEVPARTSGFQISLGGAPAPAPGGRRLVIADTFLLRSIEIIGPRNAKALGCCDHRICKSRSRYWIRHVQRATDTMQLACTTLLVLRLLEEGQHAVPVPANAPPLTPVVVVLWVAAHVDHAIDGGRTAKRLAARHIDTAVVELRLRGTLELPVHSFIHVGLGEPEWDVYPRVCITRPGLKKQHAIPPTFRQSGSDHSPRRPCARHDKVERFVAVARAHPSPRCAHWIIVEASRLRLRKCARPTTRA